MISPSPRRALSEGSVGVVLSFSLHSGEWV
jgi:hypothetical protein